MIIEFDHALTAQVRSILQEAGYHEFRDPNTGKASYSLRLDRKQYPRFHVYVHRATLDYTELDLHIDQKKASYEGHTAHSGEYDGSTVQAEGERLLRWLNYYAQHHS